MEICKYEKKCGGCQLWNMDYERQLRFKQGREITLLGKFGHVEPIIGMDDPLHYRCKVQAAFNHSNGHIISGVYQSSSHRIVPLDECLIEDAGADRIVVTIRKLAEKFKLRAFDDRKMTGFLRHVLIRKGCYTGQYMVVLVTAEAEFPSKKQFLKELLKLHPEITTVVQNVNNRYTSLVLGEKSTVLYGDGYIEDTLCGCTFRISPKSFYQVNPPMAEKLYQTAIEYLELTGKERVIDAYCGTGTIGIIAAKKAKQVIGTELNPDAVRDARENAKRNGIENIEFVKEDASDFMQELSEAGAAADAIIMDPPRAGSTVKFMKSAIAMKPKRIVYVSCNPETLARDLDFFTQNGYTCKKIQPVDMFAFTEHVETVCLLSRT